MSVLASVGWQPIAVSVSAAIIVAALGAMLTDIGPWYFSLRLPSWKPPDWAFGPIWTTIITLACTAAIIAWGSAQDDSDRQLVIALFAINSFFNILWNVLFFCLQHPDWACIEVIFLWLSIAVLIIKLARLSMLSSVLLAPYLIWVSIAAVLNYTIVQMN